MRCPRLLPAFISLTASVLFSQEQDIATPGSSVADLAEEVRASLVKITQEGRRGTDGLGTGFVISEDGLIATNLHVIGEARRLLIETADGDVEEVTEVHATDSDLDLAILRVKRTDLPVLELGDSDAIRQGDPIIAMGNPEGLAFSVVEGVISAMREIDSIPMIQVAIPIEQGNSGGPILDPTGNVLGLVTLKSLKTDNLGFAMPVNELKKLLRQPNPVPIEQWLTIGVLNPKLWQPVMGARWTQYAGAVEVEMPGDGFGGRSLCLWMDETPGQPFECAVAVKLNDESGAAGLAFCSDGGDRHYGFYPSGGKLRLTRFEGADVYSWTILADVETDAYRNGGWNTLRVRVDEQTIHAFVNGRKIIEQEDAAFRGGRAGLCKFRQTQAVFRSFRLGDDLSEKPIDATIAKRINASLETVLAAPEQRETIVDQLVADAAESRRLMAKRRAALEDEIELLRELEDDVHRQRVRVQLIEELDKPEERISLLRCALLLARHDNPLINIGQYTHVFQSIVEELADDPSFRGGSTEQAVKRLNRYLFEEHGYHGSRHDYYDRSNSYINEVLDDREGLPITLSVLFLELADRLRVANVRGIPLPGHFMVGYRESEGADLTLVDVFDRGRLLSPTQAAAELTVDGYLPDNAYEPATKRAIIRRMINNLLSIALDEENPASGSLPYLDLALAIDPDSAAERITRARLRERVGDKSGAQTDVLWLIDHLPEEAPPEAEQRLHEWLQILRP
jgi:regulator of sirC expression with transglutaminase-like and TPR domain